MVERLYHKEKVAGPIPAPATMAYLDVIKFSRFEVEY